MAIKEWKHVQEVKKLIIKKLRGPAASKLSSRQPLHLLLKIHVSHPGQPLRSFLYTRYAIDQTTAYEYPGYVLYYIYCNL